MSEVDDKKDTKTASVNLPVPDVHLKGHIYLKESCIFVNFTRLIAGGRGIIWGRDGGFSSHF